MFEVYESMAYEGINIIYVQINIQIQRRTIFTVWHNQTIDSPQCTFPPLSFSNNASE